MESILVGAFKVKDGLFIGDEFAAQDLEFVVANKVSRIVNCAARQVPNHWEPIGINYLSFGWLDTENQLVLDTSDKNFNNFFKFIEQGLETGESVLVHSVRGVSRCVCVVAAYLIKKYNWSLYKSLDFIAFRRPDLDLNPGFLNQLGSFESRLNRGTKMTRTDQWDQILDQGEELVLTNTFLNARMGCPTDYHVTSDSSEKSSKLTWTDCPDEKTILKARNPINEGFVILKSILKGKEKSSSKFPLCNLTTLKEKSLYSRFSFGKDVKNVPEGKNKFRSASLNRNDNSLVKEAIHAARGLIDFEVPRGKMVKTVTLKSKKPREEAPNKSRPTTAPQKRASSPKLSEKKSSTIGSLKGSSLTVGKKR
jgi:hypothetical protein